MPKLKIDSELYDRVKRLAEKAGYTSPDEFVTHMLEREANYTGGEEIKDEEVLRRLKGLGYIS